MALKKITMIPLLLGVCLCLSLSSCSPRRVEIDDSGAKIAEAWSEFRMGEYRKAIEIFSSVAQHPETSKKHRLAALYGLACSHWQKLPDADKPRAIRIFNQIIEESPDSEYAAWSGLALIRIDHIVPAGEKPDYPALRARYLALFQKFPKFTAGHEGFIYMAATYVASMQNEDELRKGLEILEDFIQKHPDSPFISSAWSLKAKACELLGRPVEMMDAMIKALETIELDPTNPRMDDAGRFWSIAVAAEFEAGDFAVAKKYYQRLLDDYPTERRRFAAIVALQRIQELEQGFEDAAVK